MKATTGFPFVVLVLFTKERAGKLLISPPKGSSVVSYIVLGGGVR